MNVSGAVAGCWLVGVVLVLTGYAERSAVAAEVPRVFETHRTEPAVFAPKRRVDPVALLPIQIGGRWGYADRQGNVIVEPVYAWADYFYLRIDGAQSRSEGSAWVARVVVAGGGHAWLLMENSNSDANERAVMTDARLWRHGFAMTDRVCDRYAVVGRPHEGAMGYAAIGSSFSAIHSGLYRGVLRNRDGFLAVHDGNACGFIDKRGRVAIPLQFAEVSSFGDSMAAARQRDADGERWGLIDKRGRFRHLDQRGVVKDLRGVSEGLAAVRINGLWGFLDKRFQTAIEAEWTEARDFAADRAAVRNALGWALIDRSGRRWIEGLWGLGDFETPQNAGLPDGHPLADGSPLAPAETEDGIGFIGPSGRWAIAPQFDAALPFFRGVARVRVGETFGYIDRAGRPIYNPLSGVRMRLPEPVTPQWPGMAILDNAGGIGEPYPFEYDVSERLPLRIEDNSNPPDDSESSSETTEPPTTEDVTDPEPNAEPDDPEPTPPPTPRERVAR
ncbi:MAG: WG repeat-containing protein [Planctomycetota bacterium]